MKKMFLLFSHSLDLEQVIEVKKSLNASEFVFLPEELQELWEKIPNDLRTLRKYLYPFRKFLAENSNPNDLLLIQGDLGAVYHMVNFAKEIELLTLYPAASEEIDMILREYE